MKRTQFTGIVVALAFSLLTSLVCWISGSLAPTLQNDTARSGACAKRFMDRCSHDTVQEVERTEETAMENGQATFDRLKLLVGAWKRVGENKNELVEYRLSARDSVLVETWTWPDKGIEALTMYHMDCDKLMATHYCPIGNQPRLLFDQESSDTSYVFKVDSVTNLSNRTVSHCVEFSINPVSDDSFLRSETYTAQNGLDVSEATYERVVLDDK